MPISTPQIKIESNSDETLHSSSMLGSSFEHQTDFHNVLLDENNDYTFLPSHQEEAPLADDWVDVKPLGTPEMSRRPSFDGDLSSSRTSEACTPIHWNNVYSTSQLSPCASFSSQTSEEFEAMVTSPFASFGSQHGMDFSQPIDFNLTPTNYNLLTDYYPPQSYHESFVAPSDTSNMPPVTTPLAIEDSQSMFPFPGPMEYSYPPTPCTPSPTKRSPRKARRDDRYDPYGRPPYQVVEQVTKARRDRETWPEKERKFKELGLSNTTFCLKKGKYFCTFPQCKTNESEQGFTREEHCRRHWDIHTAPSIVPCFFCCKDTEKLDVKGDEKDKVWQFGRLDNCLQHFSLHFPKADTKGKRTSPDAAAPAVYMALKGLSEAIKEGLSGKERIAAATKYRKRDVKTTNVEINELDKTTKAKMVGWLTKISEAYDEDRATRLQGLTKQVKKSPSYEALHGTDSE